MTENIIAFNDELDVERKIVLAIANLRRARNELRSNGGTLIDGAAIALRILEGIKLGDFAD